MKQKLLRDLIESRVTLGREASNGFRGVRCAVCNDHTERAGFKFEGNLVAYWCFNCKASFNYEEGSTSMPPWVRKVLEAFGISGSEISELVGSAFFKKSNEPKTITMEAMKPVVNLFTPEVPLPPRSHPIGSAEHPELQAPLIAYIRGRGLDPVSLNAHFSLDPKYLNRVILPCTRDGKIIFWQARTITDQKPRFMAPGTNKEAVLWGYDNLRGQYDQPLFITEGIFDAASIDGVALLGSQLNEAKLQILNRSRRTRAVVIDRDDNGGRLGQLALEHGWEITFPPDGCDANKSVQRFGKLFTIWTLMKNMTSPSSLKTASGVSLQSQLELSMQLSLAKLGRK
jgi:hypothetical protein